MKILFVIAALRNGGAERVLQILSAHLCQNNKVVIAVLENDEHFYEFDSRIKILNLNVYESGSKLAKYAILRQSFKEQNPDLIISFIDWTNVACVIANFGLNYPLIATEHNSFEFMKSKIFSFVRNFCYSRASFLSVLTHSDLVYYQKFNKNIAVVYNPFFGEKTQTKFIKENAIISVGRLEKVKNYEGYFKALSLIDKNILKKYTIYIAGDGSQRKILEQMAKNLDLNIKFLGHRKDITEFYKKSKILVLNSLSEGFSNVLIESAFYGCARISTATAGAKELIKEGKDGILVGINNENELAKKLEILLKNEALQKSLVINANANLSRFEPSEILKQWDEIIKKVAKK